MVSKILTGAILFASLCFARILTQQNVTNTTVGVAMATDPGVPDDDNSTKLVADATFIHCENYTNADLEEETSAEPTEQSKIKTETTTAKLQPSTVDGLRDSSEKEKSGLPIGVVVAIVLALVVALLIAILVVVFVCFRSKSNEHSTCVETPKSVKSRKTGAIKSSNVSAGKSPSDVRMPVKTGKTGSIKSPENSEGDLNVSLVGSQVSQSK